MLKDLISKERKPNKSGLISNLIETKYLKNKQK